MQSTFIVLSLFIFAVVVLSAPTGRGPGNGNHPDRPGGPGSRNDTGPDGPCPENVTRTDGQDSGNGIQPGGSSGHHHQ